MNRRAFLTGGMVGASAWATGMWRTLVAPALGATPDTRAAVFFVVGGGMQTGGVHGIMPAGVPVGHHKSFDAVFDLAPQPFPAKLAALEPIRERVLVVDGLNNRMGSEDSHSSNYGPLSCALHPTVSKFAGAPPGGITIDQHLAAALGRDTPKRSLLVGFNSNSLSKRLDRDANMFATAVDKPAAHIVNVALLQQEIFGAGVAAPGGAGALGGAGRTRVILDNLRGDIGRLRARLAAPERVALDEYLGLVEDHERRLANVKALSCTPPGASPAAIGPEAATEIMLSTVTLAIKCGVTRVAGIAIGTGGAHEDMPAHPKLHEGELDGHKEAEYPAKEAAIQSFHMRLIAAMSQTLGDGVVISYQADTGFATGGEHHATSKRHPIIIVGTGGGRLRAGGRYIRYPRWKVALADAYCSIAHAVGVPTDRFGRIPTTAMSDGNIPCRGPLPQLMV